MPMSSKAPGIVVAVDGSAAAKAAVEWAAREAVLRDLMLTVVHVASPVAATWPQTPLPLGLGRWQRHRGKAILDEAYRIAHGAAWGHPLNTRTETYYSAVVPTLVDMSKDADAIVVGRDGEGALGTLLGSVAAGLVHHARCPVAVIPADYAAPPSSLSPVLVGVDGSPNSEQAISVAFDEASRRHVDLIALHAWSDTGLPGLFGLDWQEARTSENEVIGERLAGWQNEYPDVTVHRVVVCDRPAHQLIDKAEEAQLVVVGSHGRGGFAGMLLGSVSTAVVQSVHIPVIIARTM